ncbi:MAG: hypothetical protein AAB403_12290 [Planctomycetota bacterium]
MSTNSSTSLPTINHVQTQGMADAPPSNKPLVFIDKLSMTFAIPDVEHRKYVAGNLMDLPKEIGSGWQPAHGNRYKYAARFHLLDEGSNGVQSPWMTDYVMFQAAPFNGEGGFLRMEWNPARFSETQRDGLFKMLDMHFDLPPPRVDEAKITRADIAIDLPGVWIGDYVFERAKSPIRTFVLHQGEPQTLYLGKQFHGQCRVYDKSAQQGDTTKELTRVEVCASPNRTAAQLHTLLNPFKSIRVTELAKIDLGIGEPHMRALRRAIRAEGMAGPLNDFPSLATLKHKAAIFAASAAVWDPLALWKTWPAAIAAAFPSFGQPDHYGTVDGAMSVVQSIALHGVAL